MRRKRLKKNYTPIDKSNLPFGTKSKVQDDGYRDSFRHATCMASSNGIDLCGHPAVGAHIRALECAGMGTKPSDDLILPLCDAHHREQEANPGSDWWIQYVLKPIARRRYREWTGK